MLILLSPSKTMASSHESMVAMTEPLFPEQSRRIAEEIKRMSRTELKSLLEISDDLSFKAADIWQSWNWMPAINLAAIHAFDGAVYWGLDAKSWSADDLSFAQDKLLILSALYGVLRPLDFFSAYRLEMGMKWGPGEVSNLYDFWIDEVTEYVNTKTDDIVVNLASQEYFKVLSRSKLQKRVVTPVFKEFKDGNYRTVMVHAKRARGSMAKFIIQNRLNAPEEIKLFDMDGYGYDDNLSSADEYVFTR